MDNTLYALLSIIESIELIHQNLFGVCRHSKRFHSTFETLPFSENQLELQGNMVFIKEIRKMTNSLRKLQDFPSSFERFCLL
jgi:hypothetical protein